MKSLFVVATLLLLQQVNGQNCQLSIYGEVRDIHSLELIAGAKLNLTSDATILYSDSLGRFHFANLCEGKHIIQCVPHFGCETSELNVDLTKDTLVTIYAETHDEEMAEILILRYQFDKSPKTSYTIHSNDLLQVRGATLGEQLKRVPGITSLNTGASIVKPVINGLHSNRLVVLNNGIRQEGQQWGSEHAPEIDPNSAEQVEVIQGPSSLQYGPDAIGGVILVSPKALPYYKKHEGWIKISGNSNGWGGMSAAMLTGSFTKKHQNLHNNLRQKKSGSFAYRVHASGRINGTIHTPDYFMKNTALNETSFSGALGYQKGRFTAEVFYSRFTTNLGIFSGSHIGNLTDLNAAFQATQPKDTGVFTYKINNPKQFIQHQLTKVELNYQWNSKVKSKLIYGYQYNLRQEYDIHKAYGDTSNENLPAFELNLWTNTMDATTEIKHNAYLKTIVGVSGMQQSNGYFGRYFIPNFKKIQGGAYYIGELNFLNWLFNWGLRYDATQLNVFVFENNVLTNPTKNFAHFSYSLGASKILGHHWMVKVNAGSAWRPPSINELYADGLHHGAAAIEVGDASLKKEVVYTVQAGTQYKSRLGTLDVNAFFNHFDGFINLNPNFPPQLTIVGAFPVFNYIQSSVQMLGANGKLTVNLQKWLSLNIQGSYLIAENRTTNLAIYGMPANRWSHGVTGEWNLGKSAWKLSAEVEGEQVFKQNRVPANADYVAPPAGYYLINAQLGLSKKTSTNQRIQFVLSCSNIGNVAYRDYLNRFRYFTDEIGRNWTLKCIVPFQLTKNKKS